jgi:hypothetical protein
VGLVFPRADRSIAVEWVGYQVIRLHPIEGIEFVEEAVTALGYSTELAHHLFRECWAILRPRLPRGSKGIHWRPQSQRRPKPRAPALLSSHAVSCRHIESRPLASLFRENTASPKCPTRIQDPDSCRSWPSKAFDRCPLQGVFAVVHFIQKRL